ncbi:MAG TPA: FolB domain-containing protein [Mariniphaga sp.]|nr:FolB domain-containing protein [Mariniphaga sp.]
MARIKVKNLLLRTYIGLKKEEQDNLQDVVINFEIDADVPDKAIHEDAPDGIVNYRTVTKKIIALVQENRYNLLEVLTHKILDLIFEEDSVKWAKVEVDKPHALRFAESVSITMERNRNE